MDDAALSHLIAMARELWDRELATPTATGWEAYGAREALERFVELARDGAYVTRSDDARDALIVTRRLIERALAVDMNNAANHKGDIPAALGLVDRINALRDRVVYRLFDEARYQTGVVERNNDECAELVVEALKRTGLVDDLTEENAKKIHQRQRNIGPAI